jgi:prepilin-type N-terminal cleavage/methylation domain-containing protein
MPFARKQGFTLAELLIALAILGVIATFTIPKILSSTGTAQFKAVAKETAGTLATALQDYSVDNAITTGTLASSLLANVNYVAQNTNAPITGTTGTGLPVACSGTVICLQLHNGAILQYEAAATFNGVTATNYIPINLDPDGTKSQNTTDILSFRLYYNGKLTVATNDTAPNDEQPAGTGVGSTSASPLAEGPSTPDWFTWAQ